LRLAEIGIWIRHIPKVLYSRGAPDQPRGSETEGEYRALAEALQKRGRLTDIERVAGFPGYFRVHWRLSGAPLVSIMICTKDKADFLQKCLVSVFERSEYQNFEVILVDNQSKEEKTFDLIKCWKEKEPSRFRRLAIDEPFNFSALNNRAAKSANGELLLFLNNDTEVISSSWLQELAGQALRPEIGAVGALLLFQDGSIQHAGIIVGGEKIAVHADRGASGDEPGYHGRLLIPGNVSAVSAACLMVRKDVFWHAGGFDEGLPRGYNDVALCLQLRRLRYSHVFLPQVKLFHHESQTRGYPIFPRGQDRLQKEKEYMIEHFPELQHPDPYHNPNLELFSENIR
jgi:GT2 family glycosyltransferase